MEGGCSALFFCLFGDKMEGGMKGLKWFVMFELVALGGMIWGLTGLLRGESEVMKEGEFARGVDKAWEGEMMGSVLQVGNDCLEIYGKVFSYVQEKVDDKSKEEGDGEQSAESVALRMAGEYPEYNTGEEVISYFQSRCPEMYSMEAYLLGKNTLWNFEENMLDQIFYMVKEPEEIHGFFLWKGKPYEVVSSGGTGYFSIVDTVRNSLDYDYSSFFSWQQEEDGSIMMLDKLKSNFFYIIDWNGGEKIQLRAKKIGSEPGELFDTITYQVEIYDEKGEELLHELQVRSTYVYESPFKFEDFNADGYLDLTVIYYYGANGGTASHYIFSPSKGEFVKLDSELDYYGMYGVDNEERRLYMHYHGSAISGTEATYQWSGEMDYEKIKQFDHDSTQDGVEVKIVQYDGGKEEVICDYVYTLAEYEEREDIWGIYYEDFIWEKEITDKTTGKKYMLRYGEVFLKEMAVHNEEIYYDGRLFVFDEDTYLIGVHLADHCSPSSGFTWNDADQELLIRYGDSGSWTIPMSSLICRDYQATEE